MSSNKKLGAGAVLTALTAIAGLVGLVFSLINGGTDSFKNIGTSPAAIACAAVAVIALVLRIVLDAKQPVAADVMTVVAGVCLIVSLAQFISPRVNTIASIITFTNNAQTMSDLSSAVVAAAALLVAVVLNIIAAFTKVNKD